MLKPLSDLAVPDPRWRCFGSPDGFGPLELEHHHADLEGVALSESIPDEVIILWDRARNTYLMSWFCYDLMSVAVCQALMALELAGRTRLGARAEGCRGLRSIIERLVKDGLLPDRFTRPLTLAQTAAELRNHWQHGTTDLVDPNLAFQVMEFCKGLIEEMYR